MHYRRFRLTDCNYFYCEEEIRYKYTIYKSFICNSVGENNSQSEFPTQKCFDLILLCKIIWCNIWGCFFYLLCLICVQEHSIYTSCYKIANLLHKSHIRCQFRCENENMYLKFTMKRLNKARMHVSKAPKI